MIRNPRQDIRSPQDICSPQNIRFPQDIRYPRQDIRDPSSDFCTFSCRGQSSGNALS